jgi:hypothetical protein
LHYVAPMAPRIAVRIVDIKGLYLPGFTEGSRPPGTARAAGYKPGYKSLDNRGRVYLNQDLEGRWTKNTQVIEITAEVTILEGELPSGARIRWSVRDPDDPLNERPEVHPDWGPYLDRNDYDDAGAYVSPAPDDDEGTAAGSPRWEEVEAYALSDATETSAWTAITGMRSKVRHHTTDVAGDNLILRAELDAPTLAGATGDETGIMTVWHRVDVEYIRMESALPLPVEAVPGHFEPAFAQLDFAAERVVPDRPYMAPDESTLGESSSRFIDEVFSHEGDPGWFCLISALDPYALPAVRGEVLVTGMVTILDSGDGEKRREYLEIPGSHPDADHVTFRWNGEEVGFRVAIATVLPGPPTRTQLWLEPHDIQSQFTAGDGSVAHAYKNRLFFFPRSRRRGAAWEPPGYGIPTRVEAVVRGAGAIYTVGMSPTLDLGDARYFAGRTILFTRHRAWWEAERERPRRGYEQGALHTAVHELVHAFGMPHKCGYFDYRTPRKKTCCMNYRPNWMIDTEQQLIPGTSGRTGNDMCGRHLKEVRRVRLKDNRGLRWK